ncbi:hypothetical protein [Microbacterium sp. 1P06AB]|uniref:hypothetical protein n=1 Tax=Microbacterium sp. 1P06AB TaxID=3132289 RepID=UPI0039A722C6
MNKPILIQVAVFLPLAGAASILFTLGWWIPAVAASLAAVGALIWVRRAVVNMRTDEALAAAEEETGAE